MQIVRDIAFSGEYVHQWHLVRQGIAAMAQEVRDPSVLLLYAGGVSIYAVAGPWRWPMVLESPRSETALQLFETLPPLAAKDVPKRQYQYISAALVSPAGAAQSSAAAPEGRNGTQHETKRLQQAKAIQSRVLARLRSAPAAPFTLQRICEVVVSCSCPFADKRQYTAAETLAHALDRLLLVRTPQSPVSIEDRWAGAGHTSASSAPSAIAGKSTRLQTATCGADSAAESVAARDADKLHQQMDGQAAVPPSALHAATSAGQAAAPSAATVGEAAGSASPAGFATARPTKRAAQDADTHRESGSVDRDDNQPDDDSNPKRTKPAELTGSMKQHEGVGGAGSSRDADGDVGD